MQLLVDKRFNFSRSCRFLPQSCTNTHVRAGDSELLLLSFFFNFISSRATASKAKSMNVIKITHDIMAANMFVQ